MKDEVKIIMLSVILDKTTVTFDFVDKFIYFPVI